MRRRMSRKTEKDEEVEKERRRTEEDNFVITSWARDHCFVKLV